jgi:hypothetical protein
MSNIGPWTRDIINTCINEFKRPSNRKKISKNIIDPVAHEILSRLLPYFVLHLIVQFLIIIVLMYVSKKIAT